jgi:circadian clock protein KaiB
MRYQLALYVFGQTANSIRAIDNLKRITEELPENQYDIEVVDIRKAPKLAFEDGIVAVPALLKKLPLPMRKVIGDLSNTEKVILELGLKSE